MTDSSPSTNPDTTPLTSPDPIVENIAKLGELFPEVVTEDGVDLEVLGQLLGKEPDSEDSEETYGLSWHGKREARQIANTPSTGTLRPAPEDGVDWDTTQNLVIEGDNLEVLKLLKSAYAGKVKLIYIDPPYNTGKDFVYKDDFKDNIRNYKRMTGQVDEEGNPLTSNPETSGRFHTDWLNMMYPRLKLAKDLLSDDGVIFISIDDGEHARVIEVCDGLFGSQNRIASFIWRKKYTLSFRDDFAIPVHEYLVAYHGGMGLKLVDPRWSEEDTVAVNPILKSQNPESEKILRAGGRLRSGGSHTIEAGPVELPSQTITFIDQAEFVDGELVSDVRLRARFAVGQETLDTQDVEFTESGAGYIVKDESEKAIRPITILLDYTKDDADVLYENYLFRKNVSTRRATAELEVLIGKGVFDNPKPSSLISYLLSLVRDSDEALILDFFAGSGTTGHAVMAQNAEDGGNRRYILVQLPEPLDPEVKEQKVAAEFCDELEKPRNIAELTKERLRRAAEKVKKENPEFDGDTGFRVFKLDSTNVKAWDPDLDDLEKTLEDSIETLKEGREDDDVLYEVLLKLGLDLCVPIETREISGLEVSSIGAGTLFACMADDLDKDSVEELGQRILDWKKELDPAGDVTCLFKDGAFSGDQAKTNLVEVLKQGGIKTVRCV